METEVERIPSLFAISLIHFFVALLLFVALLHGEHDLVVLSLLVLGLFGGAKLWARASLSGIKCHLEIDRQRLFPGEEFSLNARAENRRFLPVWLEIEVPVADSLLTTPRDIPLRNAGFSGSNGHLFDGGSLPGQESTGSVLSCKPGSLGFFRRERQFDQSLESSSTRASSRSGPSLYRGATFSAFQERKALSRPCLCPRNKRLSAWAACKHIHWKASARYSRLQEKLFEPSGQEKILLLLDVAPFARQKASEEFEQTIEIAASLAVSSERKGYAVGLLSNGNLVGGKPAMCSIGRGPSPLPILLETLARLQMESVRPLSEVLRQAPGLPWGMSCVCFSYEQDEEPRRGGILPMRSSSGIYSVSLLNVRGSQKVRGKIYSLAAIRQEVALQE
jgi:hypothetical protein